MNVGKILFPNKYSLVLLLIAESGLLLQARLLWMSVYQYVVVLVLAVILVTLAIERSMATVNRGKPVTSARVKQISCNPCQKGVIGVSGLNLE